FIRVGFGTETIGRGDWIVDHSLADDRLKQHDHFWQRRPIDPAGRDATINYFVSVPFVPVDARDTGLIARNDLLVSDDDLCAEGAMHFCFQTPTEAESLVSESRIAGNEVVAQRHQRLPDKPKHDE